MNKRRILMCNEASFLLTGFSNYGKAILNRLVDSNKFEVAEFATYGKINEPRLKDTRWRYYANAVFANDPRYEEYKKKPSYQFGEWRFESVLLDFKPDIVFAIRDFWMDCYQAASPLRPYYHLVWMPTVDSYPQREEWIETYTEIDGIFTYSNWGLEILRKQGEGRINLQQAAYPGVDLEVFKPVKDKAKHRSDLGFTSDSIIIGTVMRNQVRKLYPDLLYSFRKFLNSTDKATAKKTYLYIHTSFPDVGWDIPALLKEFNLGNKVLFTYICKSTKKPFCSFFQDARTYSPFSGTASGVLPNTQYGLTLEQLADIYNLFDLYVQYSICEGFGMPMVEATGCGIPIAAVDYSAMSEVSRMTGGFPIKVQRMFRELGTNAYRAYPDNDHLIKIFEKFTHMSEDTRKSYSRKARKATERYFNWDRTAKMWIDYFENAELTDKQGKWNCPINPMRPIPSSIPNYNMGNSEFVAWLFHDVIQEPEKLQSLLALNTLRGLNYGVLIEGNKATITNRQQMFEKYQKYAKNKILCEQVRCGMLTPEIPDFIRFAHEFKGGGNA